MKTNNSKTKTKAFLGAALMLLIALLFTACPQRAKPKPKHTITFSVDSTTPNGTLKAKADGVDETSTSPITVEHGKEVIFTAKADDGYKVGKWTVTGSVLETGTGVEGSETAKVKITADTTVSVSFELNPVEGGAVLILSPDKLTIEVRAVTADDSAITVEGCKETTLASGKKTTLTATGTTVILKGNITGLDYYKSQLTALNVQGLTALQGLSCEDNKLTELNVQGLTALQGLSCVGNKLTALNVQGLTNLQELRCSGNQLTELNVQGLTALQVLFCEGNKLTELNVQGLTALQTLNCSYNKLTTLNLQGLTALKQFGCFGNKLNAQAMTELLNALPAREEGDNAMAILYSEWKSTDEGNCKDFSQPADLKKAFEDAKSKKWKLQKMNANGDLEDL